MKPSINIVDAENKIVSVFGNIAEIGGEAPTGVAVDVVLTYDFPPSLPTGAESCEVITHGECNVNTTTCVAGDWFTSDDDGLAVKTESGFALGRILRDPVDGLALCVVSPVML
jgi:hypothetical protein